MNNKDVFEIRSPTYTFRTDTYQNNLQREKSYCGEEGNFCRRAPRSQLPSPLHLHTLKHTEDATFPQGFRVFSQRCIQRAERCQSQKPSQAVSGLTPRILLGGA